MNYVVDCLQDKVVEVDSEGEGVAGAGEGVFPQLQGQFPCHQERGITE